VRVWRILPIVLTAAIWPTDGRSSDAATAALSEVRAKMISQQGLNCDLREVECVTARLTGMMAVDQLALTEIQGAGCGQTNENPGPCDDLSRLKEEIFKSNRLVLIEIRHLHGWPTRTVFGEPAALAAWLIAQHSDDDIAFQRSVLPDVEAAVERHEALAYEAPYLEDRISIGEGRPQLYGTQGHCIDGGWRADPILQPDKLDERRKSSGLDPYRGYLQMTAQMCSNNAEAHK